MLKYQAAGRISSFSCHICARFIPDEFLPDLQASNAIQLADTTTGLTHVQVTNKNNTIALEDLCVVPSIPIKSTHIILQIIPQQILHWFSYIRENNVSGLRFQLNCLKNKIFRQREFKNIRDMCLAGMRPLFYPRGHFQ